MAWAFLVRAFFLGVAMRLGFILLLLILAGTVQAEQGYQWLPVPLEGWGAGAGHRAAANQALPSECFIGMTLDEEKQVLHPLINAAIAGATWEYNDNCYANTGPASSVIGRRFVLPGRQLSCVTGNTITSSSTNFEPQRVVCEPSSCPVGDIQTFGYDAGTWDETSYNFTGGPASICSDGCTYNSFASSELDVLWYDNGTVWVNEEFISDGSECSGEPDAPSDSPPSGVPEEEWPAAHYCDQGGGSDGVSFCDTRDPNHPEYDPSLPPTDPGAIYCDEQGGHDGRSFCNTWSPHHPAHPDYDGTGDGDGGTSGDGSYPGPGGGTGGTGEGGEGDEPPQIGFCPPGTVQSERHFHGEDQTAVCVPEGDEFDESLDGLDLSGELPPGWLVMPTLPEPSAGTCSCPEDHVISVMGSSVPISYGPICGVAELLRPVFLLLVYLGLAFFLFRMVAGGNK